MLFAKMEFARILLHIVMKYFIMLAWEVQASQTGMLTINVSSACIGSLQLPSANLKWAMHHLHRAAPD